MPQYVVCSRRRYACLLVLLPTIACTFIVSVLLCQHLVQHPLQCLHIESTRLIHDASFLVPPDDASNLVRVYVQDLPPALFNLTDWDAEPFYTKHLAAPLGGPVNGTDLSLLNTSQNALEAHFWSQLLTSPLRMDMESQADITFIPCPSALYQYALDRGAINESLADVFGAFLHALGTQGGPPLLLGCVDPPRALPLIVGTELQLRRRLLLLVGSSANERDIQLQSNMVLVPYPSNRHHHPAATRPLAWVHTAQRALQDAGPGSTAVDPDRNSDTIEIQGTTQEGEGFGEKHGMGGMGNAHAEQGKGVRQPGMMQEDKGMVHVTVETEHDLSHDAFILHGGVMPNSTNGSDSTDGWGNTSIHNDNNVGSIENADLVQGPIDQHITQQQPVADQQQAPEGTPSEDTTTTVQQQRRRLTQDILGSPSTHPLSSASHPLPAWTPPYLVSMIFAWPFNSLQTAAYEDCDAQPAACRTAAWDRGHPQRVATVVKSAWYCLLLPGDEWSRKQLWDCVADGGIPVVLHGDTLRAMPFREFVPWEDILMVGMSEEQVLVDLVNTVDAVAQLHQRQGVEGALQRLATLHRVWHLLQYSSIPCHQCVRWDSLHRATSEDDAFTMMLKAVASKIERQLPRKHK